MRLRRIVAFCKRLNFQSIFSAFRLFRRTGDLMFSHTVRITLAVIIIDSAKVKNKTYNLFLLSIVVMMNRVCDPDRNICTLIRHVFGVTTSLVFLLATQNCHFTFWNPFLWNTNKKEFGMKFCINTKCWNVEVKIQTHFDKMDDFISWMFIL